MRNKSCISILGIILLLICSNCSNKNHEEQQHYKNEPNYKKINFIDFIKDNDGPLDVYNEFLVNKEFTNILEHSHYYFRDVLSLLNSNHLTPGQVAVSVCAMQNLNVHDYVKLCNVILYKYDEGKLPFGTLEHAISPNFWIKRIIINNYENTEVIALINKIQHDKKITDSNFLSWLPDILSGKFSKELKEFDEANR